MGDIIGAASTRAGARGTTLIVRCVAPDGADDGRAIDSIGGVDAHGTLWHLPLAEAVERARSGVSFVVEGPRPVTRRGEPARVPLHVVVNEQGTAYLRADGGHGARLADLPRCTHRDHAAPDPGEGPLFRECAEAVAYLQKHCPHLLPDTLASGQEAPPVPLKTARVSTVVQAAAVHNAWRTIGYTGDEEDAPRAVLWRDGPDALLVLLDSVEVDTDEGLVTVSVDVACDQLPARSGGTARVFVDLVVGTEDRPTGMLVAALAPRGPEVVTRRWGDALTGFAWRAMIDASAGLAAALGHDADGAPLVPARWAATRAGLSLGTQARHPFDRIGIAAGGGMR